jgi:hypothetical protein
VEHWVLVYWGVAGRLRLVSSLLSRSAPLLSRAFAAEQWYPLQPPNWLGSGSQKHAATLPINGGLLSGKAGPRSDELSCGSPRTTAQLQHNDETAHHSQASPRDQQFGCRRFPKLSALGGGVPVNWFSAEVRASEAWTSAETLLTGDPQKKH